MKNNRHGNVLILAVVLVALALLVGGGFYYQSYKPKSELENPVAPAPVVEGPTTTTPVSSEDSPREVFSNQPGAVKSVTRADSNWTLVVNLLSPNPRWIPGGSSDVGGFFIDQNPKTRNLVVTSDTKTYSCDGSNPTRLTETSSFLSGIQDTISRSKTDEGIVGEFGYTAYFDINGTTITALYQQCLP